MKRSILILFLLTLSAAFLNGNHKYFQPTPKPIIIILDASGSMWQKTNDEYKIAIARKVLGDLVNQMKDDQAIGLVAYGHREKGSCDDIEVLLPFTNQDKEVFQASIEKLNPLGKTPLAGSVKIVLDQLSSKQQSATIILITDGLETCSGDLCQLAADAKKQGVNFVMHIVGFGMEGEDITSLECAARASEGLYLDAKDAQELSGALKKTSELTVDIPPGHLAVKCIRDGNLVDAGVVVYKSDTEEEVAYMRTYTSESTNPALFRIPSGKYDVEARVISEGGIQPIRLTGIEVQEDLEEHIIDFSSGQLEVTVTSMGELHDAIIYIMDPDSRKILVQGRTYTSSDHNPFSRKLSPGNYITQVKSVSIKGLSIEKTFDELSITAGQTIPLSHDFEVAYLSVGATYQGSLCDASINIVSSDPPKAIAAGRTYTSSKSNPKSFAISPGSYEVTVKGVRTPGDPKEVFKITLNPGESVTRIIEWK